MKFEFTHFRRDHDYWLGRDPDSGGHLLGIPVSNAMVDYIEAYWIDAAEYADFLRNDGSAAEFADACRRREHDDRLTHKPGTDRGIPR